MKVQWNPQKGSHNWKITVRWGVKGGEDSIYDRGLNKGTQTKDFKHPHKGKLKETRDFRGGQSRITCGGGVGVIPLK